MPFTLTLLVIWPFALIGVALIAAANPPEHHDDLWLLPRRSSLKPDIR